MTLRRAQRHPEHRRGVISLRVLLARLVATVRGRPLDAALDEEIRAHLDRLEEQHRARGLSPRAAREAARREFGGVEPIKEAYRDQRGLPWLDDVRRDLRHAVRALLRSPGFTVVAVVTLALGIGANSAMFSLVDAVVIRPLPFDDRDRLVMLAERAPTGASTSVAPLNFLDWSEQSDSFDAMAALVVGGAGRALASADGVVEEVPAQAVTARFFDVFGVRAMAGRTFGDDDAGERPDAVVLGEGLWRSRFGADPALIGRTITLDGQPFTVIGIVPTRRAAIREMDPQTTLFNVARMEDLVASTLSQPRMYAVLLGVFASVGVLLAVIGLYGVLAYFVTQRRKEIGIRMAIGAQRGDVLRLVLRQSLVLSGIGVALGLLGAAMLTRYLERLLFGLTPLDPATFVAVSLLFIAVATLASYVPPRRATRIDPMAALRCE